MNSSGEFRYVFYAPPDRYDETIAFYRDVLTFPIVGGFEYGVFFEAAGGVIEVIRDPGTSRLRGFVFQEERFTPAAGGWLVIEVPSADELYAQVSGKAEVIHAPMDWEWRFRDFMVKDPCGNIVCLFHRIADGTPSE